MKRDLDLCRRILLAIEEHPDARLDDEPEFPDVPSEVVSYHIQLLVNAGLISAEPTGWGRGRPQWIVLRLTWAGHEFLDTARDDKVWDGAKKRIGDTVKSVSLDVLKSVLTEVTKSALGLRA
jgi:predicted ArsR family transcriptional regulator